MRYCTQRDQILKNSGWTEAKLVESTWSLNSFKWPSEPRAHHGTRRMTKKESHHCSHPVFTVSNGAAGRRGWLPGPLQPTERLFFLRGLKVHESDGFKSSRVEQVAVDEKVIVLLFIVNLNYSVFLKPIPMLLKSQTDTFVVSHWRVQKIQMQTIKKNLPSDINWFSKEKKSYRTR